MKTRRPAHCEAKCECGHLLADHRNGECEHCDCTHARQDDGTGCAGPADYVAGTTRYEVHDDAGNRWTGQTVNGVKVFFDYDAAAEKLRLLLRDKIGCGRLRIVKIEDERRN